jgi:hypothetical protein
MLMIGTPISGFYSLVTVVDMMDGRLLDSLPSI